MPVTMANINRYASAGDVYVFPDKPANNAFMAHTGGIPAGGHTRHVGATIGEAITTYTPTIATVDIEQVFGGVAPRLTAEACTVKATLAEASWRNIELALQQSEVHNYLAEVNSSFELGAGPAADNWVMSGTATLSISTDAAIAGVGTKAQQIVTAAATPGGITSLDFIEHPKFVPGAIAVLSCYLKASAATPNYNLKIEAFNAAGVSQGTNNATVITSTAWLRYSVAYVLPANTVKLKVTIADAVGVVTTMKVDNVQLEVVPSGVAPTPYVAHRVCFVGGHTKVDTFPMALVSKQTDTAFYNWVMLYAAVVDTGAAISMKRGNTRQIPVTFTALPDTNRDADDQLVQIVEEK